MASVALASPRDPLDILQARPTVYKSGTLVQSTGRVLFCQTPVSSARPSLSDVIIVKAHWSCFQNAMGIFNLDFLSILAKRFGSTYISGNIFNQTYHTLCRPSWWCQCGPAAGPLKMRRQARSSPPGPGGCLNVTACCAGGPVWPGPCGARDPSLPKMY